MEERLRKAAEYGNIDALYALIQDDANIFRRIDELEFVDTPLHIAASAGRIDFAMEMMNLKPSFTTKLDQRGLTPIHLALQHGGTDLVIDLLSIDSNLARVKGREGHTPLHYVAGEGNVPLLSRFLSCCPDSIFDLTIRKETALHIAARHNRLKAFKLILQWIQKTPEHDWFRRRRFLNLQDKDGNTALHIAASINHHKMIELLINCKEINKNLINKRGLTALDILQQQSIHNSMEGTVSLLNRAPSRFCKVLRNGGKLNGYYKDIKPETINALLVLFTLVLAMTYQAILSPPGGGGGSGKDHEVESLLTDKYGFYMFYVPNGVAFFMAWAFTLVLLRAVVPASILPFLFSIYLLMCLCYGNALLITAPSINEAVVAVFAISIIWFSLIFICSYLSKRRNG